jgi:hypothetical protein
VAHFTSAGRFGYFRHMLRDREKPVEELLAAHLYQARAAQVDAGNEDWYQMAVGELITLMRDDYQGLIKTLSAVSEI